MVSVQSDQTPDPTPGRTAKAAASHTNAGAVARGDRLAEEREDLAAEVRAGRMKPAEAHRRMKRDSVAQRVAALPDDVFRVIYADPPWKYGDERVGVAESTAAEHHYPTMPVADICALPVREIAASDAVLFLWATFPLLPDALAVVTAWGFKYKTAFVWAKGRPNMGHYHQADAELLLVATRGSCTPDVDTRETQVQLVKRTGRHSAKPEDFRDMIDRMYPHGARVELFARSAAPDGWCVWGNEA
jgi:N6-adenosine-specific RNA methylase IME4